MDALPTYIDVHIIQTVPPANLNRDDTGTPKSARFGGIRRARVSSQAWKRAARQAFDAELARADASQRSIRTRRIVDELVERLVANGLAREHAEVLARTALESLGLKPAAANSTMSQYLLFFGVGQLEEMARRVTEAAGELVPLVQQQHADEDETAKSKGRKARGAKTETLIAAVRSLDLGDVLKTSNPPAVALFGRMVADTAALNVDAACQVAHALSTHAVELEFDYFTAVDDLNPVEETGAGMIGTVEFNAATLYRYATVNVGLLAENLGEHGDPTPALAAFLRAWVTSIPSGHQTTFGHRTLPELTLFVVRKNQPVNLAGAFEDPVRSGSSGGIAAESARRLIRELQSVESTFGLESLAKEAVVVDRVRVGLQDDVLHGISESDLATAVERVVASAVAG